MSGYFSPTRWKWEDPGVKHRLRGTSCHRERETMARRLGGWSWTTNVWSMAPLVITGRIAGLEPLGWLLVRWMVRSPVGGSWSTRRPAVKWLTWANNWSGAEWLGLWPSELCVIEYPSVVLWLVRGWMVGLRLTDNISHIMFTSKWMD